MKRRSLHASSLPVVLALCAVTLPAQASVPGAIAELVREAEALVEQDADPPRAPDYASRTDRDLAPAAVGRALVAPAHRDAFVDAYVRWQLTSLDVELPVLDDRRFRRLLETLPRPVENPRCDRRLLATMTVLSGAGPIPEARQATIRAELDRLAARTSRADARRGPALGLRRWLAAQCADAPARRLDVGLETISALVTAGWPCEDAKRELEALCTALGRDAVLDDDARRAFAARALRLAGHRRARLAGAAIRENVLEPSYDETAVDDFEVRRWIRALETPPDP